LPGGVRITDSLSRSYSSPSTEMGCTVSIHVPPLELPGVEPREQSKAGLENPNRSIAAGHAIEDKEPADSELDSIKQQYYRSMEKSLVDLQHEIASGSAQGFVRTQTLQELQTVKEGDVLRAVRRLLWECAEKPPEVHNGRLVCIHVAYIGDKITLV
jgi:hypothetical protein